MRLVVLACLGLTAAGRLEAGPILDYLRDYDLNDYALGLGLSVTQNPYLGADGSAYAYPYLNSLRHTSTTDDWLLIRDGELGFRWVTDRGWELGAIGRIQTLGFGNPETDELRGVAARKWTLELGPTIGWRGWPVHIHWTSYVEPGDRHNGTVSQLAITYPLEYERGFVVPSIDVIRQSADYADYYFSVSEAEATPDRPAYRAGAATNTAFRLRVGYALTSEWLLTAHIGVERFGSEITASPIVDRNQVVSGGLGLAYNADLFQPREYNGSAPRAPQFDLRVGAFIDRIDTVVARDTADGMPGFETDLEDVFGVSDDETLVQADLTFRIGHYHRIELGYFELARNSMTTLVSDLTFGDEVFLAGTDVDVQADLSVLRAGYSYSLIRNAQLEVGLMAGAHVISLETDISAGGTGQRARSRAGTPLPVVGAHGTLFLGDKTTLSAKLQVFRTDFDRFEGSLNYAALDLQYRLLGGLNVGLGYSFYGMKLTSRDRDVNGYLKVRHHGPLAFFSFSY